MNQSLPSPPPGGSPCRWYCVSMPPSAYRPVWHLQKQLVAARRDKTLDSDTVLILEHLPVYTYGRRSGPEHLTVSESFLKESGIGTIQVERGGSITFHGPGQVVVYPIMDLQSAKLSVTAYVTRLEEIMLRTAADWGIEARRNPLNRGIWADFKKMGSVGIAIRHGIAFHGLALNVDLSLEPFSWIHPCGLEGIQVTSLAEESKQKVSSARVRSSIKRHFEDVFEIRLEAMNLQALERQLLGEQAAPGGV